MTYFITARGGQQYICPHCSGIMLVKVMRSWPVENDARCTSCGAHYRKTVSYYEDQKPTPLPKTFVMINGPKEQDNDE